MHNKQSGFWMTNKKGKFIWVRGGYEHRLSKLLWLKLARRKTADYLKELLEQLGNPIFAPFHKFYGFTIMWFSVFILLGILLYLRTHNLLNSIINAYFYTIIAYLFIIPICLLILYYLFYVLIVVYEIPKRLISWVLRKLNNWGKIKFIDM